MKIFFLFVLFPSICFSSFGNFVAVGVSTNSYKTKNLCVQTESSKSGFKGCFQAHGEDIRVKSLKEVDDLSKPLFETVGGVSNLVGYEKKIVFVDDPDKKASYEAEKKEKEKQLELIRSGNRAIAFGEEMIKYLVGTIRIKNLPKQSRKQMRKDFESIISSYKIGSNDIALEEILALPEDGLIVTSDLKAKVKKLHDESGIQ